LAWLGRYKATNMDTQNWIPWGLSQNSGLPKQHCIESCKHNLTMVGTKLALDHQTKFVVQKLNYNFYLRSNLRTSTEVRLVLWSMQQLDKGWFKVLEQLRHFLGTSETWTLLDFCCRVHLELFGQGWKDWLMIHGSIHLMRSFQQACNLSFHVTFWFQILGNILNDHYRYWWM